MSGISVWFNPEEKHIVLDCYGHEHIFSGEFEFRGVNGRKVKAMSSGSAHDLLNELMTAINEFEEFHAKTNEKAKAAEEELLKAKKAASLAKRKATIAAKKAAK